MAYHALAFGYEVESGRSRYGAWEVLAMGMRNGHSSIRATVRLAVELFDLLYQYEDYDAAALDELRQQYR